MQRVVRFCFAALLALTATAAYTQKHKSLVEAPAVKSDLSPLYHASHALIVGINKYPGLPAQFQLGFAVSDAKAMRDVLVQSYGFSAANVALLTDQDATKTAITHALNDLATSKVQADDRVLIFFSCHGQTVPLPGSAGEMGFLIPADAKVNLGNAGDSAGYLDTCIPMSQVWDSLKLCPAKHILVLCDACFSGLMASSKGLAVSKDTVDVMLSRPARQVITAGRKGEQTTERSDLGHGVFTAKLLDELKARAKATGQVFTVSDLFASLQVAVSNSTSGKQSPQLGNFDTEGEFLFAPGGVYQPAGSAQPSNGGPAKQPDAAHIATIHIDVTPADAKVLVDGKPLDPGSKDFKMDLGDFPGGSVNIHATKDGYQPGNQRVTVKRGQTVDVTLTLTPEGSAATTNPPKKYSASPPPAGNENSGGEKKTYTLNRDYTSGETEEFSVTLTEEMPKGEHVLSGSVKHTVVKVISDRSVEIAVDRSYDSSTFAGRTVVPPKPSQSQMSVNGQTGFQMAPVGVPSRQLAVPALPRRSLAVGQSETINFRGGVDSAYQHTTIKFTLTDVRDGIAYLTIEEEVFPKDGSASTHMDETEQVDATTGKLIRYTRTEPGFLPKETFTKRMYEIVRKGS
ncbi:MAG TPA: caspase family protein [Fimbriimonadaceae bacterium]|nr:caspase family protein [Fimbriimonadaceae bacterium]